jgi:hypothetical protein
MHKLGAPNRTRAVLSAIRLEWLPLAEGIEPAQLGAIARA